MALPSADIQVAFGNNPRDASPSFTSLVGPNAKSSLRRAHVARGRSHMAQRFEAGTADFELNNEDSRYDPAFTSGPHGANLKPMKPCQLVISDGVTDSTVFRGFTDRWAVKRQSQNQSIVDLSAVDIFGLLATKRLRDTAYFDAVQALSPDWYWRFADRLSPSTTGVSGAVQAESGPDFDQELSPESVDGPHVTDPSPALHVASDKGYLELPFVQDLGTNNAYSVVFWFRTSSQGLHVANPSEPWINPADGTQSSDSTFPIIYTARTGGITGALVTGWALWLGNLGTDQQTVLYHVVNEDGSWSFGPPSGAVASVQTSPGVVVNDGKWHHIAVTRDSAGTHMKIYVDGALKATQANAALTIPHGDQNIARVASDLAVTGSEHLKSDFDIKDMAWWFSTCLSASDILDLYNAGIFPPETVADRLNRCLDIVGVPAGWRNLDTGPDLVAYTDPLHHTFALEHMQTCVDSDAGRLFTTADGTLTYQQRTHAAPAVSATFSDTASGSEIPYQPGDGPQVGPEDIYSEIDISGPAIKPVLLSDATSDNEYGTRTFTLSNCQLANQTDANNLGAALLARLKEPSPRVEAVAFTVPSTSSDAYDEAVGGELMDRVTLKEQGPVNDGSPASQTSYVEHIELTVVPDELLAVAYALSPF